MRNAMCLKRLLIPIFLLVLSVPGCAFVSPAPAATSKHVVTLKVVCLRFQVKAWEYVFGYLVAPMDGTPFKPPKYVDHVTYGVPFDTTQPAPIQMKVKWTYARSALQPAGDGSQVFHSQLPVKEWQESTVAIPGPIPENPEYLLLLFYPEGVVKAEILSKAQYDAGAMDAAIERFKKETFVDGAYPKKDTQTGW